MNTTIQPMPLPRKAASKATLIGCVGLACATVLTPFVSTWESGGRDRLVAYQDIVGVWTLCDGETLGVKRGQTDTREGCALRLDNRLARDFAPAVLSCTPTLRGHPYQLAATISLAYNIGTAGYCRSTVDRRFDAGQWQAGCDAFLAWNKAGGRAVQGLTNRRQAERGLCMKELPR